MVTVEADEIVEAIRQAVEAERRKKQAETQSETKKDGAMVQLIVPQAKDTSKLAHTKHRSNKE
jgi:tRNA threonylcarbamoyladenosine modification (KEOPS) complex  Pcc1 subunit